MRRLLCFIVLLIALAALARNLLFRKSEIDLIVVLAGGVGVDGVPHETVLRRLRRAAELHTQTGAPVLCNGGGTTHKPKYVDAAGYAVPEAALMGRELVKLGVPAERIALEGYSDDTIGNAFFARVMHCDARPDWRRIHVITSEFQIARTRAIYHWIFGLQGAGGAAAYELKFEAVDDAGALPKKALRDRQQKEAASLAAFESGSLVRLTRLKDVHAWVTSRHAAYSIPGVLEKKPMDAALAASY